MTAVELWRMSCSCFLGKVPHPRLCWNGNDIAKKLQIPVVTLKKQPTRAHQCPVFMSRNGGQTCCRRKTASFPVVPCLQTQSSAS